MAEFKISDLFGPQSIPEAVPSVPVWDFREIPLGKIVPSPKNKYRICDIEEMADSIELNGLLHNLTVRLLPDSGQFELISGERRFHALQLLHSRGLPGYDAAPCKVEIDHGDIVAELNLLHANALTRPLSDWEKTYQATRIQELLTDLKKSGTKLKGRTREVVAKLLNVSPAQVGVMESINNHLVPEAMEEFKNGKINISAAYETSRLPPEQQAGVVEDIRQGAKVDLQSVKQRREPTAAAPPAPLSTPQKATPIPKKAPSPAPPPAAGPPAVRVHDLKAWPEPFDAVAAGLKPWEYRRNDRAYMVGDVLHLMRYDPAKGEYTGHTLDVEVLYIMQGGLHGIPEGYVIMSVCIKEG